MLYSTVSKLLTLSALTTLAHSSPIHVREPFTPPIPSLIPRAENPCPTSNSAGKSIITTWDNSIYLCEDDTNYIAGDITGIIAYSLQDCADACATLAEFGGGCDLFTHNADIARSYSINNGANCWLKKVRWTEGKNRDGNGSSGKLIRGGRDAEAEMGV